MVAVSVMAMAVVVTALAEVATVLEMREVATAVARVGTMVGATAEVRAPDNPLHRCRILFRTSSLRHQR